MLTKPSYWYRMRSCRYKLIKQISVDYNLDLEELMARYQVTMPQKRKKQRKDEDLVEMEEVLYKGQQYLVDSNDNVYTYDTNDEFVVFVGKCTTSLPLYLEHIHGRSQRIELSV